MKHLKDRFGRRMHYLRISVTDRCNLRCRYCMPADGVQYFLRERILRYEEVLRIAKIAYGLGMRRVRITGGEPLVRKDVVRFIHDLHQALPKLEDLAVTTNGILLESLAGPLKEAGVDRVNVSLDTLDRDRFRDLTRVGNVDQVIRGIQAASSVGLNPIKLNAVLMRGVNDDLDSVMELQRFAAEHHATLRFIELMPVGAEEPTVDDRFISSTVVIERLQDAGIELQPDTEGVRGGGPAVYYRLPGGQRIGFIAALTNGFCSACSRLRLTAEGKLYPCLASRRYVDLRGPLRGGAGDGELVRLFEAAVDMKPQQHDFGDLVHWSLSEAAKKRMSRMGG